MLASQGAILEGLKHAKGNLILLLDADLRNLNYIEINNAIKAIEETPDIDMLILRRIKAPLFVKITRGDVLSTGERIVKRSIYKNCWKDLVKDGNLNQKLICTCTIIKRKFFGFLTPASTHTGNGDGVQI